MKDNRQHVRLDTKRGLDSFKCTLVPVDNGDTEAETLITDICLMGLGLTIVSGNPLARERFSVKTDGGSPTEKMVDGKSLTIVWRKSNRAGCLLDEMLAYDQEEFLEKLDIEGDLDREHANWPTR